MNPMVIHSHYDRNFIYPNFHYYFIDQLHLFNNSYIIDTEFHNDNLLPQINELTDTSTVNDPDDNPLVFSSAPRTVNTDLAETNISLSIGSSR